MPPPRYISEYNDGSYNEKTFPVEMQGPDLWVGCITPAGLHRISLYIINNDGDRGSPILRDYVVELKGTPPANPGGDAVIYTSPDFRGIGGAGLMPLEKAPTLGRTRVTNFYAGVYKQFVVSGAGTWWVKIGRNHSICTKISGVMIDALPARYEKGAKFAGISMAPPDLPPEAPAPDTLAGAAQALWSALDQAYAFQGNANYQRPYRLLAYRAAAAAGANDALLTRWRWELGLWTDADRDSFNDALKWAL